MWIPTHSALGAIAARGSEGFAIPSLTSNESRAPQGLGKGAGPRPDNVPTAARLRRHPRLYQSLHADRPAAAGQLLIRAQSVAVYSMSVPGWSWFQFRFSPVYGLWRIL